MPRTSLRDGHDGRVEWAVEITTDLRHALKHDASLLLENRCESSAGGIRLGQVVKVEIVLGSLGRLHGYFFFDCVCGFRVFLFFNLLKLALKIKLVEYTGVPLEFLFF